MWGIGGGGLTEAKGSGAKKSEEVGRKNDVLKGGASSAVGVSPSAGEGRGGVGADELFCYQVTECVVRPDVDLKRLIATAMRVSEVSRDC